MARSVAASIGNRTVVFDTSKADGQYRKYMSNTELRNRLPNFHFTPLDEGIRLTAQDYLTNKPKYRHVSTAKL